MARRAKLQRRNAKGGICPARNPTALMKGGETHQNVAALANDIAECTGVQPPLLIEGKGEVEGVVYVDPAALIFNYIIQSVIRNPSVIETAG